MSHFIGRDAADGYVWLAKPTMHLSAGPTQTRDDEDEAEDFEPRPFLGFATEPCPDCGGEGKVGPIGYAGRRATCLRCTGTGWVTW